MYQMRCCAIDTYTSAAAFAGNHIGLYTCAVGVIHYLHTLSGIDISGLHQVLINRDTTNIIKVGFGNLYTMNL